MEASGEAAQGPAASEYETNVVTSTWRVLETSAGLSFRVIGKRGKMK